MGRGKGGREKGLFFPQPLPGNAPALIQLVVQRAKLGWELLT
jgi:hypothetical protein